MRTGLLSRGGGGSGAGAKLWAGCWFLSLALLSFSALVTAQFTDEDGFDIDVTTTSVKTMQGNLDGAEPEGEDSNSNSNNNNTMRCWSCVARYRSWADCQNLDEQQECEDPDVTTCMKSVIRIEGLLGRETRYHRLAGCGKNESALREAYFEFFEITFGESDRVTLEEFTTCEGPLCNVMDEAALERGKWRTVHGHVVTGAAGGRVAGSAAVTLLMGVVLAIRSLV